MLFEGLDPSAGLLGQSRTQPDGSLRGYGNALGIAFQLRR